MNLLYIINNGEIDIATDYCDSNQETLQYVMITDIFIRRRGSRSRSSMMFPHTTKVYFSSYNSTSDTYLISSSSEREVSGSGCQDSKMSRSEGLYYNSFSSLFFI